jgi:type IV pilus assembly protein PilM
VAVEIARHRISAAAFGAREGALSVTAHATEPLLSGAIVPSLNAANIADMRAVVAALRRVFERIGVRPKRVALAVPDSVAKVSILRFEKVPQRTHDLDELVKWQVRKAAPFRIEDAQLSHMPGLKAADGSTEFVVVMARKDIVREYEAACEEAGAQAGVVDLSTFNVINAVLAGAQAPADDWLLVHVTQEDATMAILRGESLVFFRNRAADGEAGLADMVHQTAMYYEDRLSGSGFGRVLLAGSGSPSSRDAQDADYLRRALEQRLGAKVDAVDPRTAAALTDRISANSELLDTLAPLVGLLARERAA